MKITWLTQSGLLFQGHSIRIISDPYLFGNEDKRRTVADTSCLDEGADIILITHDHPDSCDKESLRVLLNRSESATVLVSESAYEGVAAMPEAKGHNVILAAPHTVWSEKGVTVYTVHAEHSDRTAVGYIIDDGKKTYYISGNTLYNYDVIDDVLDLVLDGVDCAFLPISGRENNMNAKDAADFAYELDAKCAVPVHYGLFDDVDPEDFDFDDRIILTPFTPTEI